MKKLRRQQLTLVIVDAVMVLITLIVTIGAFAWYKSVRTDWHHLGIAMIFWGLWIGVSVITEKFRISEQLSLRTIVARILLCNMIILGISLILVVLFRDPGISRLLLAMSFLFITFVEFLLGLTIYNIQHSNFIQEWIGPGQFTGIKTNGLIPPPNLERREFPKLKQALTDAISKITGKEACEWICANSRLESAQTLLLDTLTRFNVLNQPDSCFNEIVNIHRINDIRRINMFFEVVNEKLPQGGIFIGCGETHWLRKQKILNRYPPGINYMVYIPDFIYHRLLPKLTLTNKLYFLLSKGKNRVISRAEILGRLVSCGFEIVDEHTVGDLLYFKARKIRQPFYDQDPSYGILIRLRRVGKEGQEFNVFKFRTMHPYSEYLQGYLYQQNKLAEGGKFGKDFRITTIGRFFRKYWLDELPMLINLAVGDIKIVGVRPLSLHYFSLYSEALQQARIRNKPGLIPPYYAQFPMPKTMEEIEHNEMEYLHRYARHPFKTDFVYFHRALRNILFRRARSK